MEKERMGKILVERWTEPILKWKIPGRIAIFAVESA
jgi:hypothetical protein